MRSRSFYSAAPSMEAVLDTATDGIMIESAERVVYANTAYATLLGYRRPADLLSLATADLIAVSDVGRLLRFGRMRVAGQPVPSSYDFAARRIDASTIRLQASVSMAICNRTPYITTIVRRFPGGGGVMLETEIAGPHDRLSPRERQVMDMLLAGKRAKMIALELGLTENTVATHRVRLLGRLGVADNRELFQYALRHRLIDWSS